VWCRNPDGLPTTTNGPEAFHSHFNGEFYHSHPPVYKVAKELSGIQVDNYAKMNSIIRNVPARVRKEDWTRKVFVEEAFQEFTDAGGVSNHEALSHFLFKVGIRLRASKKK